MFKKRPLASDPDHSIEWSLFMLVAVISLHCGWSVHSVNPYELLRHGGDALGYYQWLPAAFIEHNVDKMYWTHGMEDGKWISLFSIGVAVLQLPFFLLGHWAAAGMGYPVDGFSAPYGVFQLVGVALYTGAGMVLAFRLAHRYSTVESALLAVVTLFAATNLFYYSVYEPTMSHPYSFFLVGLFCYCSLRLLDGPDRPARAVHAALFIASGSMLVLVRQLNILVFLFPLLLVLDSAGGIKGFLDVLLKHRTAVLVAALLALVPWVLQSMYWHHITGDLLTFTYGKKGEHFEFDKMVPGLVMMSPRNGWFVYTPIMVPVVVTLVVYAWRRTKPARAIAIVLLLTWLMYSAWWCWWLGTSYSYRGFVDLYALLAIPMAWMFRSILTRAWAYRLVTGVALIILIQLNFGLMERFSWEWSFFEWTWQRLFEQVSLVFTG